MSKHTKENLKIEYVSLTSLRHPEKNPRVWSAEATEQLKESIIAHGIVDPLIVNSAPGREGILIGGNFRAMVLKELGYDSVPVVYVNIPGLEKEQELILRLNKNTGDWDYNLLAEFDESFLSDIGFSSEDLDDIFPAEEVPEVFDIQKELKKLNIETIETKEGDVYDLDGSRLMCGDSMNEAHILQLMDGEKADMCFTDPPYMLNYLRGKKKKNDTEGFGYKRDRHYLGTDTLPENFTELWMKNISLIQKESFHIIVYENWKNLRTIWGEMEKYWKVKNMLVWHLPNRTQGFSAKYKFFSKYDIAVVGTTEEAPLLNEESEDTILQEEYETALYAISGKPQWEGYEKGKKVCPTDFIEFHADDAKHSGQGLVFGTKPIEILIPYVKVLTKRGDIIIEPFGGSGSTLIAATKMERRCYVMEKSSIYTEVIKKRWEKLTGKVAKKIIYDKR